MRRPHRKQRSSASVIQTVHSVEQLSVWLLERIVFGHLLDISGRTLDLLGQRCSGQP